MQENYTLNMQLLELQQIWRRARRAKSAKGICSILRGIHDRNSRLSYLGKSRLAWIIRACAEQLYWRNVRGHCVIIKNVILALLA